MRVCGWEKLRATEAERMANGLCDTCGDPLDTPSKRKCRRCLDLNRDYAKKSRKRTAKTKRMNFEMCRTCNEIGHRSGGCPEAS